MKYTLQLLPNIIRKSWSLPKRTCVLFWNFFLCCVGGGHWAGYLGQTLVQSFATMMALLEEKVLPTKPWLDRKAEWCFFFSNCLLREDWCIIYVYTCAPWGIPLWHLNLPLKSKKGREGESLSLLQISHLILGYLLGLIDLDKYTAL